jgi:hypothetical protein
MIGLCLVTAVSTGRRLLGRAVLLVAAVAWFVLQSVWRARSHRDGLYAAAPSSVDRRPDRNHSRRPSHDCNESM